MTVTGTALESSVKICVIPSLVPRMPFAAAMSFPLLELDLDVHPGRQVQALQLLNRLRGGFHDVDEPLVREHLEVLAAVLVLVGAADDRVQVPLRGKGNRPHDLGPGADHVIHDLPGRLVQDLVIVGPQLDPYPRRRHQRSPPERRVSRVRTRAANSSTRATKYGSSRRDLTSSHTSGQSASGMSRTSRTARSRARLSAADGSAGRSSVRWRV